MKSAFGESVGRPVDWWLRWSRRAWGAEALGASAARHQHGRRPSSRCDGWHITVCQPAGVAKSGLSRIIIVNGGAEDRWRRWKAALGAGGGARGRYKCLSDSVAITAHHRAKAPMRGDQASDAIGEGMARGA